MSFMSLSWTVSAKRRTKPSTLRTRLTEDVRAFDFDELMEMIELQLGAALQDIKV